MTGDRSIDYEALTQQALRGVVRTVLAKVAKTGLPGDHHFYIAFDTQYPGVSLSRRLREKYPEEMTIVMQHRFWDLSVSDDVFEVKLTFDGIPERLVIPLAAVRVFFDPSVRYSVQFDDPTSFEQAFDGDMADRRRPRARPRRPSLAKPLQPSGERTGSLPSENQTASKQDRPAPREVEHPESEKQAPTPLRRPMKTAENPARDTETQDPAPTENAPANGGAQIVSLDAFRKK